MKHYKPASRSDRRNDARENHEIFIPLNADALTPKGQRVRRYEGIPTYRINHKGMLKEKAYAKSLVGFGTSRVKRWRREVAEGRAGILNTGKDIFSYRWGKAR